MIQYWKTEWEVRKCFTENYEWGDPDNACREDGQTQSGEPQRPAAIQAR
jgi:hypothetical protein